MPALITIEYAVPTGYEPGDYAKLCGNGGAGAVDYDTPVDNSIYELFPGGAGILGFGHGPFGHFRFGHGYSARAIGFGHLPFGHFPFGYGSALIQAKDTVYTCGSYKYGFACYDELGNQHSGTPGEIDVYVHVASEAPTTLKKYSYNKTTDVLILEAA